MKSAVVPFVLLLGAACAATPPAPATPTPAPVATKAAPAAPSPAPPALPEAFAASLAKARITFAIPAGFSLVAPVENPHWQYPFAMRADDGSVEVRIRVDDLAGNLADEAACKAKPGCVRAKANEMWRSWHFAIAANIAGAQPDKMPGIEELDRREVAQDFGGDAAALALVTVDEKFGASHGHAVVALVHKDDRADAVIVLLFDDPADVDFERALGGLRFEP